MFIKFNCLFLDLECLFARREQKQRHWVLKLIKTNMLKFLQKMKWQSELQYLL